MSQKTRMQSVLEDEDVVSELVEGGLFEESLESLAPQAIRESVGSIEPPAKAIDSLRLGESRPEQPTPTEAIIVRHGYPSLLVQDGKFEEPKLKVWRQRLKGLRPGIEAAIASVGRIELIGNPRFEWVGTGWMIDGDTIITNSHVASEFARQKANGWTFKTNQKAYIDFREEHLNPEELEYLIGKIVHVEVGDDAPDLALLRLESGVADALNITPISLSTELTNAEFVGVIGYPAFDSRNSAADQSRIFSDIYDVKRFAPGKIMDANAAALAFTHNATTLGGNSGSSIIDLETGAAVGLHFGGRQGQANWAVKPDVILEQLRTHGVQVKLWSDDQAPRRKAKEQQQDQLESGGSLSSYKNRRGYDPEFLGKDRLAVPLPVLNALQLRQASEIKGGGHELKYTHFSIVMNAERRLAFFTACNVDGTELWQKRRGRDKWVTDPRLDDDDQVDNDLYYRNDFDRGHLVRRLDPVWGPKSEASQAERDSFHYTNAAPQHKDLNQKIWLDLEDHVLDTSKEADARISIFTGPIFGSADPKQRRTGVGIPLGFWKIIASAQQSRGGRRRKKLECQAFVIWQWDMFDDDDLELIFGGGFDVYQLTVIELERLTGLDFQNLRQADTFGFDSDAEDEQIRESLAAKSFASMQKGHFVRIERPEDMIR